MRQIDRSLFSSRRSPWWRLLVAATSLMPGMSGAQSAETGEIFGTAMDAHQRPLAGVTIVLIGSGQVEVDSTGFFRFRTVPTGTYLLRAMKVGVQPVLRNVDVAAGARVRVEITMDAATQLLSAVVVRADSAPAERMDPTGFLRRQRTAQGVFITGDEITHRSPIRTEQMFNGIPSVRVDTGGIIQVNRGVISYRDILVSRRGNNPPDRQLYDCVGVQVFVDGALMPQPFNVNDVAPQSIRGIELYRGPATTPPELRSPKSACGTLAIWTR